MSKLQSAVDKARASGHDLEHDPPHLLSSMDRFTCRKCGRAVLGNHSTAYGSATDGPCKSVT